MRAGGGFAPLLQRTSPLLLGTSGEVLAAAAAPLAPSSLAFDVIIADDAHAVGVAPLLAALALLAPTGALVLTARTDASAAADGGAAADGPPAAAPSAPFSAARCARRP